MASSSSAVTPKRILAWVIDTVLVFAIAAGLGTALGRSGTFPNSSDAQEYCDIQADLGRDVVCINAGSNVFEWDTGRFFLVVGLMLLVAVLNHIVLQGSTGASVGKRLTGLRVVDDATSQVAGFGPMVIRFLLWIIDGLSIVPFIPMVGGILMLTSDKSQRLGDRLAKTRVIDASHVGINTADPMSPAAVGLEWAQPTPGEALEGTTTFNPPVAPPTAPPMPPAPTAAPPAPDTAWAPPTPAAPEPDATMQMPTQPAPAAQPAPAPVAEPEPAPAPWEEPTTAIPVPTPEPDPDPEPEPEPEAAPSFAAPEPAPAPEPEPEPEPEVRPGIDAPMWDEARGTHIQWDPKLQKWMGWDQAESRWKPL